MSRRIKWSLLGIADHQGVANVGGRLGAAAGPEAFRKVLRKLKGRQGVLESRIDLGDYRPSTARVETSYAEAAERVRQAQEAAGKGGISIVVGGGHDHGFSHLKGVRAAQGARGAKYRLGCINIDAHLDVRKPSPLVSSGSPFYLAIESSVLDPRRFVEFGIQSHCNAPELWDYVEAKRVQVVGMERLRKDPVAAFGSVLRKLSAVCDGVVVSLDLDAAAEAFAPGVSAPQAEGFTGSQMIQMAEIAGAARKVLSLGIFELNPLHDVGDRTSRLAATVAYHFAAAALGRRA